jgi:nucleotide-binding universal stress UspA family protein
MVEETGAQTDGGTLARRIGPVQLMGLGIGATIGTGIFFVLSTAVPEAGPAVVVASWPGPGPAPGSHVAAGADWAGALAAGNWLPGDLLVVGSSRHGPLARVFLGSTATKIVRASPVPVVVVPRGAAAPTTRRAGVAL